jgi:trans-aconitate 2-methyltransferase
MFFASQVPGDEPVLEWTKGTALLSVFEVLTGATERAEFVTAYGRALFARLPRHRSGTFFALRRIFAVAHKKNDGRSLAV